MSSPAAHAEAPTGTFAPPPPPAVAREPRSPARGAEPAGPPAPAPAQWWVTPLIAAVLCWVAFTAGGGLNLARMTTVEISLTIGAGLLVAYVALSASGRAPVQGAGALALLVAFSALTALSVVWSVQPDSSWQDAGRMLAYSAVFAGVLALVRAMPERWPAVLGAVVLAAVVVCGWALLTKVFPDQLDAGDPYARLRAPYSYWNAIGLTAAMGAIACLWLGGRRAGHALLGALAYPAMGLMLLTVLLAYSRGALVALALGTAAWFILVPLRLRGAAVLLAGGGAAGAVAAWAFGKHALSSDNIPLDARTAAGHQLGALLAAMLIVLLLAGLAISFRTGRRAPSAAVRRRAGVALAGMLALAVLASVGALAASHRGLTGSVSHTFHTLTDPHAAVPSNTPGRLTGVASVRARYWNEALKVFQADPVLGAGAEGYATARLRYRTETLDVRHAHGYVVQTLADLGVIGLVLTLALLGAWMVAAGRGTHPLNREWSGSLTLAPWRRGRRAVPAGAGERPAWRSAPRPYTPERVGLLTMLAIVIAFGVHSFADWTWYVPSDACVALLCAGWLAGRGSLESSARGLGPIRSEPWRLAIAGIVVTAALLAAWAQWQPERSTSASQHALALLSRDPRGAEEAARAAVARDPVSAQALVTLAAVQKATGRPALARATLERAVRLQPSNPQAWLALGEFDLAEQLAGGVAAAQPGLAQEALRELSAGIYLNPELIAPAAIASGNREAITVQNDYVQALRATSPPPAATPRRPPRAGNRKRTAGAKTSRPARR